MATSEEHRPRDEPPTGRSDTDYPRFIREHDELVKVGWSPNENRAYEHRAPKSAVDAVCRAILAAGKAGHRFTMHEISRAVSSLKHQLAVPSYQMYAIVSWLKWGGMVVQHGRQGYTVVKPQTFNSSVETAWMALKQR